MRRGSPDLFKVSGEGGLLPGLPGEISQRNLQEAEGGREAGREAESTVQGNGESPARSISCVFFSHISPSLPSKNCLVYSQNNFF